MSLTPSSQTEPERDEDFGRVVAKLRDDLISMLCRTERISVDVAEEAAAEAVATVFSEHDPVTIAIGASKSRVTFDDHLLSVMRREAKNYISRERRRLRKTISENTPIGDSDDGDLSLSGLFTPRANTAEHIECFAECMMFFRKHGRAFQAHEIEALFGVSENVSVMDAAKELGITPEAVAKLRMSALTRAQSLATAIR